MILSELSLKEGMLRPFAVCSAARRCEAAQGQSRVNYLPNLAGSSLVASLDVRVAETLAQVRRFLAGSRARAYTARPLPSVAPAAERSRTCAIKAKPVMRSKSRRANATY